VAQAIVLRTAGDASALRLEEIAVGSNVAGYRPGDRIGYVSAGYGAYASERLLPAARRSSGTARRMSRRAFAR
jgi:hypothetical protein